MDSSNIVTLGTPKPTIASRRPMLNSKMSLVINTSATHKTVKSRRHNYHQTPSSHTPPVQKTMSPEELSSKIADSFQQFSSMLSQLSTHQPKKEPSPITSPLPTSVFPKTSRKTQSTTTIRTPSPPQPRKEEQSLSTQAVFHENALDTIDAGLRPRLLTTCLIRAASTNDLSTMQHILHLHHNLSLVNEADDLGMTPVMYAAYFGYIDCLSLLLTQPALNIDQQDKKGWTALIWASLNNQLESVQCLLDRGSNTSIKTKCGKKVFDYPLVERIQKALPATTTSSPASILPATPLPSRASIPYDVDFYYQTSIDGYNHYLDHKPASRSTNDTLRPDLGQCAAAEDEAVVQQWADSIKSLTTFSWTHCLPDQMFVFSEPDLHIILDHALHVPDVKAMMNKSPLSIELWQPANIVFLAARFVLYYSTRSLLTTLLHTAAVKLSRLIKAASRETHTLAYWIANMCQLSSYLKKDPGLFVSTTETQTTLSELISEAYGYFISESQRTLEKSLDVCVMDFESFQEQVDFADDWQRFFRRSSYQGSSTKEQPMECDGQTPQAMTYLLSDMQHTLQAYHVPSVIVIQAMAQFFHYLSCEIFNRVLTVKKYLCRSKALQIRMNVSVLEDWVRTSQLPLSLNQSLEPLVQLLQLLQCLSQLEDAVLFTSTVQTFDKLNPLQVRRCVQHYRYEIGEAKLPDPVEKTAADCATHYSNSVKRTSRASWETITRPSSISDLDSLLTSNAKNKRLSSDSLKTPDSTKSLDERRDAKYLLPFSIMNTTALLDDWTDKQIKAIKSNNPTNISIYKEIKFIKQHQSQLNPALDKIFPEIPQEWIYNLDKKLYT